MVKQDDEILALRRQSEGADKAKAMTITLNPGSPPRFALSGMWANNDWRTLMRPYMDACHQNRKRHSELAKRKADGQELVIEAILSATKNKKKKVNGGNQNE